MVRSHLSLGVLVALTASASAQPKRPMTPLDIQLMKQAGSPALSPNGQWLLYTLSVPDWKEAKKYTDIWIVSTTQGAGSARQLTFTKDKNETSPVGSPRGASALDAGRGSPDIECMTFDFRP